MTKKVLNFTQVNFYVRIMYESTVIHRFISVPTDGVRFRRAVGRKCTKIH